MTQYPKMLFSQKNYQIFILCKILQEMIRELSATTRQVSLSEILLLLQWRELNPAISPDFSHVFVTRRRRLRNFVI